MSEFTAEIKKRREERKLSIISLGRRVNCSSSMISRIESDIIEKVDLKISYSILKELGFIKKDILEDTSNSNLSEMLKSARETKKITIEEISKKIGYSSNVVVMIENGLQEQISIESLYKWFKLLELDN